MFPKYAQTASDVMRYCKPFSVGLVSLSAFQLLALNKKLLLVVSTAPSSDLLM